MKITLDRTPEQVELIKAVGSRNAETSVAAQEILAYSAGQIIQQVLEQVSISPMLYSDYEFDQDTNPSIPLDLYVDKDEDYIRVWQQSLPGGLATNFLQGLQELKFTTYELDSAVSMFKKYARLGEMNNVARALKRMAQEILAKQEYNAFIPILSAVAGATTNGLSHVIASDTPGSFTINDLNRLWTRARKINTSWNGKTPIGGAAGITDLFVSPEVMEDVRGFSYNPVNTINGTPSDASNHAGNVALPDSVRESIYRAAGTSEIFGVTLHDMLEFSPGSDYSVIFDNYYGGTFTAGTSQIALGVDATRDALIRPIELNDNGGQLTVLPDDQFPARADKIGWYAKAVEGRVVLDDRALLAIVI